MAKSQFIPIQLLPILLIIAYSLSYTLGGTMFIIHFIHLSPSAAGPPRPSQPVGPLLHCPRTSGWAAAEASPLPPELKSYQKETGARRFTPGRRGHYSTLVKPAWSCPGAMPSNICGEKDVRGYRTCNKVTNP